MGGQHRGKGCLVAAFMMGLIMISPFAGAAYALMTH